jgi:hypothetical protein
MEGALLQVCFELACIFAMQIVVQSGLTRSDNAAKTF